MLSTSIVAGIDAGPSPGTRCDGFGYKNLFGSYHPPVLSITDRFFFKTLREGWLRHGIIEIIKMAVVNDSQEHWSILMMRSANEFGTFSEYWSYVSWVAAQTPEDLAFHDYEHYGETTERFFDDGTGLFSILCASIFKASSRILLLSYAAVEAFILLEYGQDQLSSSLAFESSPRQ